MTVIEAAKELSISPSLLYRMCSAGLIGHYRVGRGRGLIRIDQSDIDELKARGRVEPPGEPEGTRRSGRCIENGIVVPPMLKDLPKHLQPEWYRNLP